MTGFFRELSNIEVVLISIDINAVASHMVDDFPFDADVDEVKKEQVILK